MFGERKEGEDGKRLREDQYWTIRGSKLYARNKARQRISEKKKKSVGKKAKTALNYRQNNCRG